MSLNNRFLKWFIVIALILSLVITGLNSNIINPSDNNVVATIGKQIISREEYSEAYRNHAYYVQSMFNFGLSERQLKEFGLPKLALNQLIQEKVLLELFRKINFEIGENATIRAIKSNKDFQTDNKFDRNKFNSFLSNARITEEDYIKRVQFEIGRDIIFDLFFSAPGNYSGLAKKIYEFQYQIRNLAITHVDSETKVQIRDPTEDELKDFYEKNKKLFKTQEYRTAEYLTLSNENAKPELITEEEALAKFNELDLEKLFDVDYIELSSRSDAESVRSSIANNAEYYQNDIVHLTRKFKYELPDVFDLKWDGNKWKIYEHNNRFYLTKIVNIITTPDEEKQKKLAEIKKSIAKQKLVDVTDAIEKELEEDPSKIEKIANKYGLALKKIGPIAKNSRDKNDEIIEISASILKNIFQTDENSFSGFISIGDEYVNIHVINIERDRILSFDEAKEEALELLKDQLKSEELAKITSKKALDGEDKLDTVVIYRESIKFEKNPEQDFPEDFTNEVFNLSPGQITKAYRYRDGFIVGKLIDVKNPEENELIIRKFENKIREDLSLSLVSELTEYYTKEFNVKIKQDYYEIR